MAANECPVVTCSGGKVKGSVDRPIHPDAKNVFSYLGIPYAEPPVGKFRFMPTQPLKKGWNGVFDATKQGNIPIGLAAYEKILEKYKVVRKDFEPVEDEDCLNLNIYTPADNKEANLPVMVFFYGGGFIMGSNASYSGVALAGLNDVVVVIPNYRLHLFGFMSFGPDSCVPGNAGLWDQVETLRWVKANIRNFGGNPDNVTIFGKSAGSISVSAHVLSRASAGLFHKAIYHSGSMPSPPLTSASVRKKDVNALLAKMDITEKDPAKVLEVLQNCKSGDLIKSFTELKQVTFNPSYDNKFFVREDCEDIFKEGIYNKVPQIIGYNSTEGNGVMTMLIPNFADGIKEEDLAVISKQIVTLARPNENLESVVENAKAFYLKSYKADDPTRFSRVYSDMIADILYSTGSLKTADYASESTSVFHYFGDFQLKCFHDKEYCGGLALKPDHCKCDHPDDLPMIFGLPFVKMKANHTPMYTDEEKTLCEDMMKYFTNFARTGNPNEGRNVPVKWPKYTKTNPQAISFDVNNITTFKNENKAVKEFWSQTF